MNLPLIAGSTYLEPIENIFQKRGFTMIHSTMVLGQRGSGETPSAAANIAFFGWTIAFVGVMVPLLFVAYAYGITADSMARVHIILEGFKAVLGLMVAILAIGYAFVHPVQERFTPTFEIAPGRPGSLRT